jgi:hypothetical protein
MAPKFFWTNFFTAVLLFLAGISSATSLDKYTVCAAGNSYTGSVSYHLVTSIGELATGQTASGSKVMLFGFMGQILFSVATPTAVSTPTPACTVTPASASLPNTFFKIYRSQINPIRGEQARLRWVQPNEGPVTIRVFNMLGDLVVTLVNRETYPAGQYNEVKWDGKTSQGTVAGSGIYTVLLEAPGYKITTKVAVIK